MSTACVKSWVKFGNNFQSERDAVTIRKICYLINARFMPIFCGFNNGMKMEITITTTNYKQFKHVLNMSNCSTILNRQFKKFTVTGIEPRTFAPDRGIMNAPVRFNWAA